MTQDPPGNRAEAAASGAPEGHPQFQGDGGAPQGSASQKAPRAGRTRTPARTTGRTAPDRPPGPPTPPSTEQKQAHPAGGQGRHTPVFSFHARPLSEKVRFRFKHEAYESSRREGGLADGPRRKTGSMAGWRHGNSDCFSFNSRAKSIIHPTRLAPPRRRGRRRPAVDMLAAGPPPVILLIYLAVFLPARLHVCLSSLRFIARLCVCLLSICSSITLYVCLAAYLFVRLFSLRVSASLSFFGLSVVVFLRLSDCSVAWLAVCLCPCLRWAFRCLSVVARSAARLRVCRFFCVYVCLRVFPSSCLSADMSGCLLVRVSVCACFGF